MPTKNYLTLSARHIWHGNLRNGRGNGMHQYKYIVTISLPCSECGTIDKEVIREILDTAAAGIPTHEISVEDYGNNGCKEGK
jgi:hypothetical protein